MVDIECEAVVGVGMALYGAVALPHIFILAIGRPRGCTEHADDMLIFQHIANMRDLHIFYVVN